MRNKKTVVLDMDHTLINTTFHPVLPYDFRIPSNGVYSPYYYIQKRPGLHKLLEDLSRNYEIIVFTAAAKRYADLVLDNLDVNKVISLRLYKDSCAIRQGKRVKDLDILGRNLKNVIIIDDSPFSYELQPENGIPVKAFMGDPSDTELWRVMDFCRKAAEFEDVREAIRMHGKGFQSTVRSRWCMARNVKSFVGRIRSCFSK